MDTDKKQASTACAFRLSRSRNADSTVGFEPEPARQDIREQELADGTRGEFFTVHQGALQRDA